VPLPRTVVLPASCSRCFSKLRLYASAALRNAFQRSSLQPASSITFFGTFLSSSRFSSPLFLEKAAVGSHSFFTGGLPCQPGFGVPALVVGWKSGSIFSVLVLAVSVLSGSLPLPLACPGCSLPLLCCPSLRSP